MFKILERRHRGRGVKGHNVAKIICKNPSRLRQRHPRAGATCFRGRPVDGRSVHVPPLAATVSGLADVSQQSRRRHRGDRPLCPADDRIPNSVLSCHCAPRTTTLGIVWRDGKPNRGVDSRGTTRRDISFGIETPRMVQSSCSGSVQWAFGTIRPHPDRPF
jgi:hypothetical protein